MGKLKLIITLLFFTMVVWAQQSELRYPKLSEDAEVSVIVCGPSHDAAFTLYGHAAIRVKDNSKNLDNIFNYGLFDFNGENFIYRFVKGETDYKLGVANFLDYIVEYRMRGSYASELVLNLSAEEKNRIWEALLENYRPENRVYRYNFFFDNCSSRLLYIVESNIDGKILFDENQPVHTFRDLINDCTKEHLWLTFGCDLVLGSPTDRAATIHEKMFLPEFLEKFFITGVIQLPDGTTKPLVRQTISLSEFNPKINNYAGEPLTPLFCSIVLMVLIVVITIVGYRHNKYYRLIDCALFFVAGIAGIVVFFVSFISEHPCVYPNWNIVWLHPLHLVGFVLFFVKKLKTAANYYHFINFAVLTLLLVGWHFIPQHMNMAFIPLVITLWVRSFYAVSRVKKNKD